MIQKSQLGAGLWVFGRFIDRYATGGYGPPVPTLEAIDRAGRVGTMSSIDLPFPFEPGLDARKVKDALEKNSLRAAGISPLVFTGDFPNGAFTSPDPETRRKTIEIGKRAVDAAHEFGSGYVKFWNGQDGYDYPFQTDYMQLWDHSLDGIRQVAEYDPTMKIGIEYKLKEPRTHMVFSTAARTLVGIQEIGLDNVGVVYDLGHSLFAKENPADVVQLLHRHGRLIAVELNDNWREWDDDMTVGSVHLFDAIEFFIALRTINWTGPLLLDQFPFREDPVEAARMSFRTMYAIDRLVDKIDMKALRDAQSKHDALAAQRLMHTLLLGDLGD